VADTPVRERQIGPHQLERDHFGGAEDRGRHGGEPARDSEVTCHLDDRWEADLHGHAHRRRIE